ncbi:hypothetical protein ACKKBF_B38765 [Auxenochlorella protothecoides x Auxenochlorella symbiontica]
MLRSGSGRSRACLALARQFACCAGSGEAVGGLQFLPPRPGTVTPYDQHLLISLPGLHGGRNPGSAWPSLVERHPAALLVFSALARHKELISSKVKVTAMEGGGLPAPAAGTCHLLAFPAGLLYTSLPLPKLGQAAVHAVADDARALPSLDRAVRMCQASPAPKLHLFVCCHGARDARCGARGPSLVAALRRAVHAAGLEESVAVAATSHIGGHETAGNVVAYGAGHPCDGDWFGGLHAGGAVEFLQGLRAMEVGCDGGAEHPLLRPWWRGRRGLTREECVALFDRGGGVEEVGALELEGAEEEDDWGAGQDWDQGDGAGTSPGAGTQGT